MTSDAGPPVYVADTHALFWFRQYPSRLSPAADAVFRLATTGEATIIIPAIVVAELYYFTQKLGDPTLPSVLLGDISRSREFVFSPLGTAQLERMESIAGVPEMHDRLIVAEALVHAAPVISKDETLRRSGVVDVIW